MCRIECFNVIDVSINYRSPPNKQNKVKGEKKSRTDHIFVDITEKVDRNTCTIRGAWSYLKGTLPPNSPKNWEKKYYEANDCRNASNNNK